MIDLDSTQSEHESSNETDGNLELDPNDIQRNLRKSNKRKRDKKMKQSAVEMMQSMTSPKKPKGKTVYASDEQAADKI